MRLSEKRYLHRCSLRSDKNQRTWDKLVILMKKVCYSSVLFFTRTSTGISVCEPSSNLSQKRKSSRDLENKHIRILLERQKEQILAEVRSEIQKHELQAKSDRRSIQELKRMEIDHTIAGGEQSRRDQLLLQEEKYQNKIGIFAKLVSGICETWKKCRKITCERSRNFQEENWLKTLRQ